MTPECREEYQTFDPFLGALQCLYPERQSQEDSREEYQTFDPFLGALQCLYPERQSQEMT
jgi:hypothetical protein